MTTITAVREGNIIGLKYFWAVIMHTIPQEAAFAALRPMMQEIVAESDLDVWMQQDDSRNPSVIYTILTGDLRHTQYTWACIKTRKYDSYGLNIVEISIKHRAIMCPIICIYHRLHSSNGNKNNFPGIGM